MNRIETQADNSVEQAKKQWSTPVISNIDIKQTLLDAGSFTDGLSSTVVGP